MMNGEKEGQEKQFWNPEDLKHAPVREFMERIPKDLLPPADPTAPDARILEAARQVFAEKGFDATSTREIAELAEVNQAMIHYYYRSKQGLYKRVLVTQMYLLFREIALSLTPNTLPEEFVLTMPIRMISVMRDHPVWMKLVRRELASGANELMKVLNELGMFGPMGFREQLRKRYDEAMERGVLRELDFDSLSHVLITLGYSMLLIDPLLQQVSGTTIMDEATWAERSESMISILRDGLAAKKGEGNS